MTSHEIIFILFREATSLSPRDNDFTAKPVNLPIDRLTYHEACHLCHGQKITGQPRRPAAAMADCEDANAPTWSNVVEGQLNLSDAERYARRQ